ncbi:uncharacterized protein LOC117120016 isoform X1 [Anneissia japonica]|uniref:uncharacterized protein LOC117120016 isoform X1 n=1 Tax=Anneissia japonica TaxID=1529436 RepID=UPI001425B7B1|nr:uncharacterized protein LOC117120016 isoform X1 [Anneissia japonica]
MELLLIYLIVTILVIHSGNATLMISVGTDPIMPGNDVKLTCISSGSVATFVWQHNGGLIALGTIIQNPARFMIANMDKQSDLTIIGFENDLDGTWECHNFGIESTSISLSVDEASCLQTEGEPCDTELELTDWHRSIRYVTQSGDVLITDYFFNDGWYKLMTEGQRTDITMPTTSPAEFECGTQYPVWINGTYPEMDGKTNVVKGCVNIPDEPCKYELELCIKACGSDEERYYVHYLVDTPGSNMGYCTDSLLPCSNGTSSVTGFPPCAGNFPVLEGEPVLAFVKEPTGVSAYCDYRMLWSGEEEIDFFVRWFIDGEYVTDGPDLSKISDEFDCGTGLPYQCILNRKAGSNIECEVSSKFKDQDAYSQGIKSKLLYAGLIVLPNNTIVFVGESEDGETFELTSTIPIVCREENSVCVPRISINVDLNGETDAVADACSRSVEYQSPASFKIMAARDGYNDGDVANYIRFEADVTSLIPFSRIWEDLSTNLPTIQVCVCLSDAVYS